MLVMLPHNYYILIYYIITQDERSPLDMALNPPYYACVPEDRKRKVIEILEREEKKLRK